MPNGFEIENGILKKYQGEDAHIVIPDGVTEIDKNVFISHKNIVSIDSGQCD